ncbi:HAD family hydrolase [Halapricum desulfuricans]|uniref:HAD superfamily hydrolase n=1 Tax=Halapricum desulfuricans TaxID=2841257 RepID=A0A897N3S7_9EURY|nr:HAD family hydrolase [Halapricum desulfuricans]QSG05749.1 HAD superfamily hydrolase [Halapricum desulfuricans]
MTSRAVVFDLDGTLAVPDRDRRTLLAEAIEATDAPPLSRSDYLDAHGRVVAGETRTPIFEQLLTDDDPSPDAVARAYREAVNDALEPVDGVETLLEDLTDGLGYRVGVLTDGPSRAQRSKLDRLGWRERFDATLVTGELDTRKPDPMAFEAITDRLGVDPDRAIYVGDDPERDVAGAAAAGLDAVQVLYDDGPEAHPDAAAVVERDALETGLTTVLSSCCRP